MIGQEILDGHPTTVSEITVRDAGGEVVYYQWWAEDIQLPLAWPEKTGWIVDYKNVHLRRLSPKMFELPLHTGRWRSRPPDRLGGLWSVHPESCGSLKTSSPKEPVLSSSEGPS